MLFFIFIFQKSIFLFIFLSFYLFIFLSFIFSLFLLFQKVYELNAYQLYYNFLSKGMMGST